MSARRSIKGWWRRVVLTGLLAAMPSAVWAIATTTVQDVLYRGDGSVAQGTLLVSWQQFTAADGSTIAAGTKTIGIAPDGTVSLQLVPNAGATPAGTYYTAVYHLADGTLEKEYWVVPELPTATITMLRSKVVPAAVAQPQISQQYIDSALSSNLSNFLPLKGGALTGALNLAGDPAAPMQAATKQYVDAHGGGGTVALPDALVKGNGASPATAATASDIVQTFHSTGLPIYSTSMYLQTSFNESAAGTSLAGTRPSFSTSSDVWHFGDAGTSWSYASGGGISGPVASASPTGGPFIDVGHSDYQLHISVKNTGGGYMMVMLRYQDSQNLTFLNLDGGHAELYDYIHGAVVQIGSMSALNYSNISISAVGNKIQVSGDAGQTMAAATSAGVLTATKVGFTLESGANSSIASLTVTSPTLVTVPALPCSGILFNDGTCSSPGASNVIAADAAGHAAPLPEIGTATDTNGNTTVAWHEDYKNGVFDCRNPLYAGGCLGPTPGAALQATANAMACYMNATGKHASTTFPNATMRVGTPTYPSLSLANGGFYHGMGNVKSGTSTRFAATYNNVPVVTYAPLATTCNGTAVTVQLDGGGIDYIGVDGCGQGGCGNTPGDTTDHPNGGPGQWGFLLNGSHDDVHDLAAQHNGGTGLSWNGLDSTLHGYFSLLNNEWYLFGHNVAGQVYDPSKDAYHGDFDFENLDGRAWDIEIYGTGNEPGTEAGHVCGIVFGGGNSSISNFFVQLAEIGFCRPYGSGSDARASDFRIDFSRLTGLLNTDNNSHFQNGFIDGSCLATNAIADLGGYCANIDQRGNNAFFLNMQLTDTGFGGAPHLTGQIYPFAGGHFRSMDLGNAPGLPPYQLVGGNALGQGVDREWAQGYGPGSCTTNADASVYNHIVLQDTAPTTCTTIANAELGQDVWILVLEGTTVFDTLLSVANGGHFHTKTGADIVLNTPAVYHFVVSGGTNFGTPAELVQE